MLSRSVLSAFASAARIRGRWNSSCAPLAAACGLAWGSSGRAPRRPTLSRKRRIQVDPPRGERGQSGFSFLDLGSGICHNSPIASGVPIGFESWLFLMPSRWLTMTIVLFWLGMTALLFYQEVWPLLQPNAPPPFTIDLVDEARSQQSQVRWFVYLEGTKPDSNMVAKTEVKYNELAGYKVTDMSLDAARFDGVPDLVRAKLNPIKDRPYDEQGFVAATFRHAVPEGTRALPGGAGAAGAREIRRQFHVRHPAQLRGGPAAARAFPRAASGGAGQVPPGEFARPRPGPAHAADDEQLLSGHPAGQLLSMEVDFHFDISLGERAGHRRPPGR